MKKQVLLTNDDGHFASGIRALYHELKKDFDVIMVAPDHEHSAQSHAITIARPLSARPAEDGYQGFIVDGTPADCVKLAIGVLLDSPPDIVVSGINLGENSGQSAFYSGTVGAAREGAFQRIPSFAFSLDGRSPELAESYAPLACKMLKQVIELRPTIPADEHNVVMYNINFPACGPKQMKGLKITKKSYAVFDDAYIESAGDDGRPRYQLAGTKCPAEDDLIYDSRALEEGYTTLTPLDLDTCSSSTIADLQELESK